MAAPITDPRDVALLEIRTRCFDLPLGSSPDAGVLAESIYKMADDALNAPPVEAPALTPAQRVADKLVAYAEEHLRDQERLEEGPSEYNDALRALLRPLRPASPPTLEEALAALRDVADDMGARIPGPTPAYAAARALLARVPK